ncbi:polyprenyl synthetase family protein, partial [Klebsiella pneumoniae]
LTGDILFSRASQLMSRLGERAIRLQADTFERLVLGQMHETLGPQEGDDPIAFYIQVLADKTGSLIAAATQGGVIFSNAPSEYEEPLRVYGEKIGVAFQLLDDVIDLSAKPEETGKVPGTDLRAGVPTMPYLLLKAEGDA